MPVGPARYDLQLYRGDTFRWVFRFWTDAERTDPLDLTGVTAKAEIRERSGTRPAIEMACVINLPNVINMELTADDCRNVMSRGHWDLQLTNAGGITTVLAGTVTTTDDITDSDLVTETTLTVVQDTA